jgi:hypothetical protein
LDAETIYSDSLVTITGENILFKRYDIFERDKLVFSPYIEKITVKEPTIWNGKFRFHGKGDFHTWFSRDFQRYKRDKIFLHIFAINGGALDLQSKIQPPLYKYFKKKD